MSKKVKMRKRWKKKKMTSSNSRTHGGTSGSRSSSSGSQVLQVVIIVVVDVVVVLVLVVVVVVVVVLVIAVIEVVAIIVNSKLQPLNSKQGSLFSVIHSSENSKESSAGCAGQSTSEKQMTPSEGVIENSFQRCVQS